MKIKRARGHRLYTNKGERILDLSMDYGRAVIGHRPNGLSLTFKNVIDRGIYASYDSVFTSRLKKHLLEFFPEYKNLYLLNSEDRVLSLLGANVKDPLFDNCKGSKLSYWRPFLDVPDSECLILLYPIPGLNSVTVLISRSELDIKSDNISPVLLSGILRSFYDYSQVYKEFDANNYSRFSKIPSSTLKAPYLILDRGHEEYEKLCCDALKQGVLLNSEKQLLVLPPDYSAGEIKKIIKVLS